MVIVTLSVGVIIQNALLAIGGATFFTYQFNVGATVHPLGFDLSTSQLVIIATRCRRHDRRAAAAHPDAPGQGDARHRGQPQPRPGLWDRHRARGRRGVVDLGSALRPRRRGARAQHDRVPEHHRQRVPRRDHRRGDARRRRTADRGDARGAGSRVRHRDLGVVCLAQLQGALRVRRARDRAPRPSDRHPQPVRRRGLSARHRHERVRRSTSRRCSSTSESTSWPSGGSISSTAWPASTTSPSSSSRRLGAYVAASADARVHRRANGGFQTYILGTSLPFPIPILAAGLVCGLLSLVVGAVALRRPPHRLPGDGDARPLGQRHAARH